VSKRNPMTVPPLQRQRKAQVEERLLMGDRWPLKWHDLVFVTTNGTPMGPTNVRHVVQRLATEAGIDGVFTPYDLRHTATSLLSAAGVAPELLADLLERRDTRMVFRHYRHQVTPTISVAADHIEQALAL
jgi:integrase